MKDRIKAVVFDVDGVLINCTGPDGNFLWQKTLEEDLGITIVDTTEKLFKKYWPLIGAGKLDTLEAIGNFLNDISSDITPQEFMKYWHTKDSNINEDVLSLAKKLKKLGYKMYIGTNQEKYRVAHIEKLLNNDKTFERIFASCIVGFEKPDENFFNIIQKEIGLDASQILFIDDSKQNIESAKRVNWEVFHFRCENEFTKYLSILGLGPG